MMPYLHTTASAVYFGIMLKQTVLTLQHAASYCNALQLEHIATHNSTLQYERWSRLSNMHALLWPPTCTFNFPSTFCIIDTYETQEKTDERKVKNKASKMPKSFAEESARGSFTLRLGQDQGYLMSAWQRCKAFLNVQRTHRRGAFLNIVMFCTHIGLAGLHSVSLFGDNQCIYKIDLLYAKESSYVGLFCHVQKRPLVYKRNILK